MQTNDYRINQNAILLVLLWIQHVVAAERSRYPKGSPTLFALTIPDKILFQQSPDLYQWTLAAPLRFEKYQESPSNARIRASTTTSFAHVRLDSVPSFFCLSMAGQAAQSPDQALYSIWGPELRCWQRDEPNAPPPTWSRLWSNEQRLRALFKDIPATERRSVAQRCCQMALACGPSRVLAFLLDDGLVKPNATFRPDNVTLLHLACLFRNADAVKLLANRYKVPWRRDSRGERRFGFPKSRFINFA